jgi:hypothetical protein
MLWFAHVVRELQEAGATIALEISSRNSRVAAPQNRWDRLRAGFDVMLYHRGPDMVAVPEGASGLLVRDGQGKEADQLCDPHRPGVVSLVAELRGHERRAAEELSSGITRVEEPKPPTHRRRPSPSPCC